ncbi:MAG: hypothetical protein WCV84_02395 [Patescibacteria group bacterium]
MFSLLKPLITLSFWFQLTGVPFTRTANIMILVLMGVLTVGGAGFWYYLHTKGSRFDRERRRVLWALSHLCLWSGLSGFALYAMVWQRIPLLSMRVWWLVLLAVFVGVIAWLAKRWFKIIPLLDKELAERQRYEKWLPKPKKK